MLRDRHDEVLFEFSFDAIARVDREHRIVAVNKSFVELFGYDEEELIGRDLDRIIVDEAGYQKAKYWSDRIEDRRVYIESAVRYTKFGQSLEVIVAAIPVVGVKKVEGAFVIYRDITEENRSRLEMIKQNRIFESLFSNATDAIVRIDTEERVLEINEVFERTFGYSIDEIRGMVVDPLIAGPQEVERNTALTKTLLDGEKVSAEGIRCDKEGHGRTFLVQGVPIMFEGKAIGGYGIYTDITELKRAEKEIESQKINFEALFKNSSDAIVRIDTQQRILDINETFAEIFGYTLVEIRGMRIDDLIAPENLEKENRGLTDILLAGEQIAVEGYRRTKGDLMKEFSVRGVPIIVEGEVVGGYGIYSDITARKMAERELATQKITSEALFTNSSDAIVRFDKEHRILEINDQFTQLFQYAIEDVIARKIDEVIINRAHRKYTENLTTILLRGNKIAEEGVRYGKNDKPVDVSIKGVPIIVNGQVVGGYGIYTDITDRKRTEEEILYVSYHDELTGLYNRRFFEEESQRLDAERNYPIGIIMADVNGLKLTNDAFGHDAGDELLKRIGGVLRDHCRSDEIIARLGGDEFVILLPHAAEEDLLTIATRIQLACRHETVRSIPLSVSTGWATKTQPEEAISDLLKRAEEKMYRHKLVESPRYKSGIFKMIMKHLHETTPGEEQHARRVSDLAGRLADALGYEPHVVEDLRQIGWYHDIGKIALSKETLMCPGELSVKQWREVQRHPEIGYRIMNSVHEMTEFAEIILSHHERYDGTGYPKGLTGERIPVEARMIALCDAYDAMTTERPYRPAMTFGEAIEEIEAHAGSQFDPDIARVFVNLVQTETQE